MQEAVRNQADGKTLADAARTVLDAAWWSDLKRRCLRYSLWTGGWSSLQPPSFLKTWHVWSIYLGTAGLCFLLSARVRRSRLLFEDGATAWRLAVLCLSVVTCLGYHAIQTTMASGSVGTNSWYAAVSFPWLMCLCCQGWACYPGKWLTRLFSAEMVFIYFIAEVYGTLVIMARAYTGHAWGRIARERLAELHLSGWGPDITLVALGLAALLVATAIAVCVVESERETRTSSSWLGPPVSVKA